MGLRNVNEFTQDLTANNCPSHIWFQIYVQTPVTKYLPLYQAMVIDDLAIPRKLR